MSGSSGSHVRLSGVEAHSSCAFGSAQKITDKKLVKMSVIRGKKKFIPALQQ